MKLVARPMKLITAFGVLALFLTAGTGATRAQQSPVGCTYQQLVDPEFIFDAKAQGLPRGLSTAQVVSLFARAGVTISWSPAASPVEIIDYAMDNGGQGAQVDQALVGLGFRNIIKQANGNPVSYTLTFAHPVSSFALSRAALYAGPSGVTNAPWNTVARATDGTTVATASEDEIRSFSNVPSRPFVLRSGTKKIASVTFSGDDHKVDGQSNVVIDAISWCP
jgi:hypothetical protein